MRAILFSVVVGIALSGCGRAKSPGLASASDSPAIFGGEVVAKDAAYWRSTVKIRMTGEFSMCTGTLVAIGKKGGLVVTAAHCVAKSKPVSIAFLEGSREVASREVTATIPHPQYNFANAAARNDIAVIRYKGAAPEQGFRAAQLLSDASLLTAGHPLAIVGFGHWRATENGEAAARPLRAANTQITSVGPNTFLTYDSQKKVGGCDGDSGGPGFVKSGDRLVLAGVLSYVISKDGVCARSFVSGLTLVPVYADWINAQGAGLR